MAQQNSIKRYIQAIALLLFLVGLPLGSWYYLQAGFDYHKELMSELQNYGRMPDFKLINQNGDTLSRNDLAEKTIIVSFFNDEDQTMKYIQKYHSQFHDRHDLVYTAYSLKPRSKSKLSDILSEYNLNNDQTILLSGDKEHLKTVLSEGYQIPDLKKRGEDMIIPRSNVMNTLPDEYPYFILVDNSGTIRNYYDVNDEKSMTRLIEHLALILPRKAEEEAVLKRETEK